MQLIDTHAHLYAPAFSGEVAQIVQRSRDQHIRSIYMPNIDVSTIDNMLALEDQYPDLCHAMIGMHPCYIGKDFQKQLAQMETWLGRRSFVAIGEIGIDLYRDKTYQAQQEEALTIQLGWAQQYHLPIVIHCRGGIQYVLKLIEKYQGGSLRGIFHCFSGNLQEAEQIIALGFYVGVGGIITFKNSDLERVVAAIHLDHLVLETDAPYLAPTPYRGQRNEPGYLYHIAQKIAAIKGVALATVAQATTANAINVFHPSNL